MAFIFFCEHPVNKKHAFFMETCIGINWFIRFNYYAPDYSSIFLFRWNLDRMIFMERQASAK